MRLTTASLPVHAIPPDSWLSIPKLETKSRLSSPQPIRTTCSSTRKTDESMSLRAKVTATSFVNWMRTAISRSPPQLLRPALGHRCLCRNSGRYSWPSRTAADKNPLFASTTYRKSESLKPNRRCSPMSYRILAFLRHRIDGCDIRRLSVPVGAGQCGNWNSDGGGLGRRNDRNSMDHLARRSVWPQEGFDRAG